MVRLASPRNLIAITALAALLAASCSSPKIALETRAADSTLDTTLDYSGFTLGPNDLVSVRVYNHPELSTKEVSNLVGNRIDPGGDLALPLVGTVAVGGLDLQTARRAITAAFEPYVIDPRIELNVVEWSARRFYLYGEVNAPGPYIMDRPLTVYEGLSFGKGYNGFANRSEIVLLRGRDDELEVHLIDGSRPHASGLIAMHPDDLLFVRRSGAGGFAEDILPIVQGLTWSLNSIATILLIDDRLNGN